MVASCFEYVENLDLFIASATLLLYLHPNESLLCKFHDLANLELKLENTGKMRSTVDGILKVEHPEIAVRFAIGLIRTRFQPFAKAGSALFSVVLKQNDVWSTLSRYKWKFTDLTHIRGPQNTVDKLLIDDPSSRTAEETWVSIMDVLKDSQKTIGKHGNNRNTLKFKPLFALKQIN